MLRFLKVAFCIIVALPFMQSCVDNDYDTDELNGDAVFKIPSVPLGNIDKFDIDTWLNIDDNLLPPGIDLSWLDDIVDLGTVTYSEIETVDNIFTEDLVDQFFFVGSEEDVVFASDIDIHLLRGGLSENPNVAISVVIDVTDATGSVIRDIEIPSIDHLTSKDNQKIEIRVPKEDFAAMENASGLKFSFYIKTSVDNVSHIIEGGNYIQLKNVLLKSGGLKFEF